MFLHANHRDISDICIILFHYTYQINLCNLLAENHMQTLLFIWTYICDLYRENYTHILYIHIYYIYKYVCVCVLFAYIKPHAYLRAFLKRVVLTMHNFCLTEDFRTQWLKQVSPLELTRGNGSIVPSRAEIATAKAKGAKGSHKHQCSRDGQEPEKRVVRQGPIIASPRSKCEVQSELQRHTVLSRSEAVKETDRASGTRKYICVCINGKILNKFIAFWGRMRENW